MRLEMFPAGDGDCFLLTSGDGHNMLIDGGRTPAYKAHAMHRLDPADPNGIKDLDLVVVTHIDADHLEGVLTLFEQHVAWTVYDYQVANGNNSLDPPDLPRPPTVAGVWHNSFSSQLKKIADDAAPLVAALAAGLAPPPGDITGSLLEERVFTTQQLATSVPQGIRLTEELLPQVGVPLNAGFAKGYVNADDLTNPIKLGTTSVEVLAPTTANIRDLRKVWRKWVADHQEAVKEANTTALTQLALARTGTLHDPEYETACVAVGNKELADQLLTQRVRTRRLEYLIDLYQNLQANPKAERNKVTPQNLASIVILATEGDQALLLTGDAHQDEILNGLKAAGHLTDRGFHCTVLKVQHHGSEHNLDSSFARQVTADHYLFTGDGANGNPEPSVVKSILDSRLGKARSQQAITSQAGNDFVVWFNTDPALVTDRADATCLRRSINYAKDRARSHADRFEVKVCSGGADVLA